MHIIGAIEAKCSLELLFSSLVGYFLRFQGTGMCQSMTIEGKVTVSSYHGRSEVRALNSIVGEMNGDGTLCTQ